MKRNQAILLILGFFITTGCSDSTQEFQAPCTQQTEEDGSTRLECANSEPVTLVKPEDAQSGSDGLNQLALIQDASPTQCPFGGQFLGVGADLDVNGELDANEIQRSFVLCQGRPGEGRIPTSQTRDATADECPTGGRVVTIGFRSQTTGEIENNDAKRTLTLCNGASVESDKDGKSTLVQTTLDLGCVTVESGLDLNDDGRLEGASEISNSAKLCESDLEGEPGINGINVLVKSTEIEDPVVCPSGGVRLEVGVDREDAGTVGVLEAEEVDDTKTKVICNGGSLLAPAVQGAVQLAAGARHTCARLGTGKVKCWGPNNNGEMGNNKVSSSNETPGEVLQLDNVIDIDAGDSFTCAVVSSGEVFCWGESDKGQTGQPGVADQPLPIKVAGITNATHVSAGTEHACALLGGGAIQCWGENKFGRLGDGTEVSSSSPVNVQGITNATQVSAGSTHTCAVLSTGGARCWGRNTSSQLGDNAASTFKPIPQVVAGLMDVKQVAASDTHTCAQRTNGSVSCWGRDVGGQFGLGILPFQGSTYSTAKDAAVINQGSLVDTARNASCAVLTSKELMCWGENRSGEAGLGTSGTGARVVTPTFVKTAAGVRLDDVRTVSRGDLHTCAAQLSGRVYCWGLADSFRLGNNDGSNTIYSTPVEISL